MTEPTPSAAARKSAARPAGPSLAANRSRRPPPWWRGAVIYQIYPRSFADSNGDGEGDLPGIVEHLDHVADLGVDAIWLSPFYPSPMADGGYDVANPRDVDPRFGTLEDFGHLVAAGARPRHPGHRRRRPQPCVGRAWRGSAQRSTPPRQPRTRAVPHPAGRGPGGEEPPKNWLGVFHGLDLDAPANRCSRRRGAAALVPAPLRLLAAGPQLGQPGDPRGLADTLRFWLDLGVDGFRVDVAFGLKKDMTYADHPDPEEVIRAIRLDLADGVERDPDPRAVLLTAPFFDRDEVHDVYRAWRRVIDEYPREIVTVAEAWAYPVSRTMAYARPDELSQVFNFDFMLVPWDAGGDPRAITSVLEAVALVGAPATWVLSNHDTPRVVTRLGGGEQGLRRAMALRMSRTCCPAVSTCSRARSWACRTRHPGRPPPGPDLVPLRWHGSRARRCARADALVGAGASLRLHHRAGLVAARAGRLGGAAPSRPRRRRPTVRCPPTGG